MYLRVVTDEVGFVENLEVLKGFSPATNQRIIEAFLSAQKESPIWVPAKNSSNTQVKQEFIFPLIVSIETLDYGENKMRSWNNNFYYNDYMFRHQHFHDIKITPPPSFGRH